MRVIFSRNIFTYFVILAGLFTMIVLLSAKTEAATINVVSGVDALDVNGQCQFSEAMQNINDQAQTNADCVAGDGNNDTIQLPSGTVTLSSNSYLDNNFIFPPNTIVGSTKSVKIIGVSQSQSIIDGASTYGIGGGGEGNTIEYDNIKLVNPATGGIGSVNATSTIIRNVEIDASANCVMFPIWVGDLITSDTSYTLEDIYIHNIECTDPGGVPTFAIYADNTYGGKMTFNANRVTISNIINPVAAVGLIYGVNIQASIPGEDSTGDIDANVSNLTVDNIQSETINSALGTQNVNTSSVDATINNNFKNIIISNIKSTTGGIDPGPPIGFIPSRAIGVSGGKMASGNLTINTTFQNVLISDSVHNGTSSSCANKNYQDSATFNFTSLGGNISDDTSCTEFFNQPTDQNNVTNLKDLLEPLSDNGGSVPTIELLPGNPAIDGGVCDGAPTTDARNISRPQGSTCDSGAYEVQQDSTTKTVADKTVSLEVPNGMVVNNFAKVDQPVSDSAGFSYPLGMMSFNLGVPSGSTQEVSLVYETDLSPEQVVARKLDTSNNTYSTLSTAQITKTTKNGNPALKVTYSIKDGEYPDLDKTANGIIVDPVGLATTSTLVNTGIIAAIAVLVGFLLIAIASYTYIDYKRHKKPLISIEPELAKQYTYTHHLRVVTIPLFKYRLSIKLEKKPKSVTGLSS
jgi:hypothetical protein